jgi:hypothetical protein
MDNNKYNDFLKNLLEFEKKVNCNNNKILKLNKNQNNEKKKINSINNQKNKNLIIKSNKAKNSISDTKSKIEFLKKKILLKKGRDFLRNNNIDINTINIKQLEKKERKKLEREKLEREKLEREKLEREKLEREKLEREKLEREKLEREKLEREKLEREKLERERLEREKLEREKLERERLEREKLERERLEREKLERERLEREKKPNIAIMLYGLPRNIICLESIENIINNLNKKYNVDVYAHINKVDKLKLIRSNEDCDNLPDIENFLKINCKEYKIENQEITFQYIKDKFDNLKKFGDYWKNNFESLKNVLFQLYSLNQSFDLIKKTYNIYIPLRIDLYYLDTSIKDSYINEILSSKNCFYGVRWSRHNGLNDRIYICDSESSKIICKRFEFTEYCCNLLKTSFHSESFLMWIIKNKNIKPKINLSMRCIRIRCNQTINRRDKPLINKIELEKFSNFKFS